MKVMQILNNICHWDATPFYPTLKDTEGKFAPDIIFIETPDFVREGWGFDPDAKDDARFIKPTPPEGWLYDDKTGTFYHDPALEVKPEEPVVEPTTEPVTETKT